LVFTPTANDPALNGGKWGGWGGSSGAADQFFYV